jgi:hypothetical protein
LLSDSSTAFRISGDSGIVILSDSSDAGIIGILDSVVGVGSSGSGGTDETTIRYIFSDTNPDPIRVQVHEDSLNAIAGRSPALYYGPTGAGAGTGSYVDTIYAVDTSGTDAALEGVKVTALDASGGTAAFDWTSGSGFVVFALDGGTYTILARKTGYTFPNGTQTVSGNVDSAAISGYDVVLSDAGENNCNVYGYIFDAGDNPLFGARIEAIRVGQGVAVDTSDAKSKIIPSTPVIAYVDTTGLFQLYLRKTNEMADTTKAFYDITATYANTEIFKVKKFYVPNAEYIDLGDSLLTRSR